MRIKIILLFLLLQTEFTFSQQIEWQNTIGGNAYDFFKTAKQTTDGGYICAGSSISNSSGDKIENNMGLNDYWVVKLNSAGQIDWQNTIGGNQNDWLGDIAQTNDGGYICGGSSLSTISGDKSQVCQGGEDFWIVKINGSGVVQWDKTFGGIDMDELTTISQTSDGGYICGGSSSSTISGDKTENCYGYRDFWIIKLDATGNIQWQNTIGGNDADYLWSMAQTPDNGFICGGTSSSNISYDKSENCYGISDMWVIKLDSTGNIQWQKTLGGGWGDVLSSIIITPDGNYVCGGASESNISGNKNENCLGSGDLWIVKLDTLGNIIWQNTIGGSLADEMGSLINTADGGYFCSGSSISDISGDKSEVCIGSYDNWIVKLNSEGIVQWQNTIGGNSIDHLLSCQQTSDQGIIIGGYSESNISGDKTENCIGGIDYWVIKITGKTNLIKGLTFIDSNVNGTKEPFEVPFSNKKIEEIVTGRIAFTDYYGNYTLSVLNSGNYTVSTTSPLYYNINPAIHSASFNGILQIDSLNDFAIQPLATINDLCISITPVTSFRAGRVGSYQINYINQGTTTLNPIVIFYNDPLVTFVSSIPAPTTIYTDSVLYNFGPLAPFQSGIININVQVSSIVPVGSLINSGVRILPIINDSNPGCNESYWEVFTVASLDPNDIIVNRDTLYDYEIANSPDLEYIIRFQNTGNDTAFYVRIDDPLPLELQSSSIEFISSSHPCSIFHQVYENTLKFTFENIMLPDSNINELASHGFVRYKIKPVNTLIAGNTIQNNANIFFDYNAPVKTNDAITEIIITTSIVNSVNSSVNIFPNPVKNLLNIELKGINKNHYTFELYNVLGIPVKVWHVEISDSKIWEESFDVSNIASGIYYLNINNDSRPMQKIIKL